MPTYEFRCPDGTIIERVFKMSEVPESIPVPNGEGVAVRMISGGADLLFKGSGFYITDYGKDGKKDLRESANKSAADSGKSSGGDSAKPAAPVAAKPSSSTSAE
jgi:predicted nucleic acid-binding Zn ribbon protein